MHPNGLVACGGHRIALQFLGSLMKCFCSKFAGTFDEQVRDMFRCILEFHDVQSVEYRLDHLKPSMIKDTKKFPSLEQKLGNRDAWCFGLLMPLGMLHPRMPWPMHFLVISPRGIKFLPAHCILQGCTAIRASSKNLDLWNYRRRPPQNMFGIASPNNKG